MSITSLFFIRVEEGIEVPYHDKLSKHILFQVEQKIILSLSCIIIKVKVHYNNISNQIELQISYLSMNKKEKEDIILISEDSFQTIQIPLTRPLWSTKKKKITKITFLNKFPNNWCLVFCLQNANHVRQMEFRNSF